MSCSYVLATLTCPECGGGVDPVKVGPPLAGTSAATVVMCDPCGMQYELVATLRAHGPRRPASLTGSPSARHTVAASVS